jgi:uncharacterized membrane protein
MGSVLAFLGFLVVLVWAFRIEANTARTAESLQRIEKLLKDKEGAKK